MMEIMHTDDAVALAAADALAEWQKFTAGAGDTAAWSSATAALRKALPVDLLAQADRRTTEAMVGPSSRTIQLSEEQILEHLRRFRLAPAQWAPATICRKANAWIGANLAELAGAENPTWATADREAHYAEFGTLSAVDFLEQCVIEDSPPDAPWEDLNERLQGGEFDSAAPVWIAPTPFRWD